MKLTVTETVARPASEVWHALAHEFDQISQWYTPVVKSYSLPDAAPVMGAAQNGRICEFDEQGSKRAIETITRWDEDARELDVNVEFEGASAALPVARNVVRFSVEEVDEGHSVVRLDSDLELRFHGYLLFPLVKRGLSSSFSSLLQDLKGHVEAKAAA
ncbi:MAG: SRPBCC family protein [Myxococcota bacterium]